MTENPYARPVEDLVADARVPVGDQVEEQAVPWSAASDWGSGVNPHGDGMSGDADCD
jgi:hypothetical protein